MCGEAGLVGVHVGVVTTSLSFPSSSPSSSFFRGLDTLSGKKPDVILMADVVYHEEVKWLMLIR